MQTICKLQIHCSIAVFAYLCRRNSNYKRIYEKGIVTIGDDGKRTLLIGAEAKGKETC